VGKLQAQFNLAWPLLTKAAGSVVLDFGSAPGGTDASVAITGQSAIIGTSLVDAWVSPAVTADHGVDEHWAEDIIVSAGNVVAGTGFTVYGKSATGTYGKFNIVWAWV